MGGMRSALIERVGDAPNEQRAPEPGQQAKTFVRGEMPRPRVHGKFLFVADQKFWIRGVTYGTFKPNEAGDQFPAKEVVERNFRSYRRRRNELGSSLHDSFALYGGWPVLISPGVVLLASLVTGLVGVAFGSLPAFRASRLDPMIALRTE